jgi:ubiquinone/menaquinone biosynthesis C-methylase UbiE
MDAGHLVTEQLAYYRARAAEGDEWWEGRAEDDLETGLRGAWRADALQLRADLERFAPSGDVLELAGGTGVFTAELLRHTGRVTVVDAAPEALAVNRARHPGATFVEADLFDWEPPRQFDAVCSSFWISHVPAGRWTGFWAMVARALRPGGRVWLCDNAHPADATAGPAGYHERVAAADPASGVGERRLRDGRAFQIVKRYWRPAELERDLAAIGWTARISTTDWAFIHGEAVPPE